jgi:hypothetical protein
MNPDRVVADRHDRLQELIRRAAAGAMAPPPEPPMPVDMTDINERIEGANERIRIANEQIEGVDERIRIGDERIRIANEQIEGVDERIRIAQERTAHAVREASARIRIAQERAMEGATIVRDARARLAVSLADQRARAEAAMHAQIEASHAAHEDRMAVLHETMEGQMVDLFASAEAALGGGRRRRSMTPGLPSDVLDLHVLGTRIKVLRSTLMVVEGSALAERYSGQRDDRFTKNVHYPHNIFGRLVDLLRATELQGYDALPLGDEDFDKNLRLYGSYLRMVEHYGLTNALYPFRIRQVVDVDRDGSDLLPDVFTPNVPFCTTKPRLFYLAPLYHKRAVASFDVEVGEGVQHFQIGLAAVSELREQATTKTNSSSQQPPQLLHFRSAMAYDALGCSLFGSSVGDTLPVGRVIRCNLQQRCFQVDDGEVDGGELFLPMQQEAHRGTPPSSRVPVIWGVGSWKITNIQLASPSYQWEY